MCPTLISSELIQLGYTHVVSGHTSTVFVHLTEQALCISITLFSCSLVLLKLALLVILGVVALHRLIAFCCRRHSHTLGKLRCPISAFAH